MAMTVAMGGLVRVGDAVPDVAFPVLGGGELALGDLRGRKAVLFFWGSW